MSLRGRPVLMGGELNGILTCVRRRVVSGAWDVCGVIRVVLGAVLGAVSTVIGMYEVSGAEFTCPVMLTMESGRTWDRILLSRVFLSR